MKKLLAIGLVISLVMSVLLTGCSKKEDTNETPDTTETLGDADITASESAEATPTAAAPAEAINLGKYDETVTINFWCQENDSIQFGEGEDYDNNLWTKHYLDDLNIQVKNMWRVNETQYDSQVAMSILNGELADIMAFSRGDSNMYDLLEYDQLADLSEVYELYASDLTKQILGYDGGVALQSSYSGDMMFGIPIVNPSTDTAYMLWLRKDWLEKSGLAYPKTYDELYQIIKNFAENDYDGVDAYGLAVDQDLFASLDGMDGLFNGFGAYAKNWVDKDGNLVYGGIQDEALKSLEFLQKLYNEGLLSPEFGSKTASDVATDLTSGYCGVAFGPQWLPVWPLNSGVGSKDTYDWVSMPLVTEDGSNAKPLVPVGLTGYYVVSKDFEHPEALIKMLNLFVEDAFGDGDINYYATSENYFEPYKLCKVNIFQPDKNFKLWEAISTFMTTGDSTQLDANEEATNDYASIKSWLENPVQDNNLGWGYMRIFGNDGEVDGSISVLNTYRENNAYIIDQWYGPTTKAEASYKATLDQRQMVFYTQFIKGEKTSTDWQAFVDEWNSLGGETWTKEVNEWYHSMQK